MAKVSKIARRNRIQTAGIVTPEKAMSDPVETGPITWETALDKDGELEIYVECPTFLGWDEVQSFWMDRDSAAAAVRHLIKVFGLLPNEVSDDKI